MHRRLIVCALAGSVLGVVSCAPSIPVCFDSPEPGARNSAIVRAAASRRTQDVPNLVRMLDSDDPVTRMLAIRTLERIEGTTLGYDPAAPQWEREVSIEQWRKRVEHNRPTRRSPTAEEGGAS